MLDIFVLNDFGKILITGLITGIVSTVVTLLTNSLSFKNKAKEIKLVNYHKERTDALKLLYYYTSEFHYASMDLLGIDLETLTIVKYKNALDNCINSFNETWRFFYKNKLILQSKENDFSKSFSKALDGIEPFTKRIKKEIYSFTYSGSLSIPIEDLHRFESMEDENKYVNIFYNKLINDLDSEDIVPFSQLRKEMENYYEFLIK